MADTTYLPDNGAPAPAPVPESTVLPVPTDTLLNFAAVADAVGGAYSPRPGTEGAVAYTHFDTSSSEDNAITILLTKDHMDRLPSQTLVRINSLNDDNTLDRSYLGTIVS